MEIANELIPSIVKAPTSGSITTSGANTTSGQITNNSKCFANILRFYDGLCSWEEGSPTPVLHIGWAKHMVATCSKFSAETRSGVQLGPETEQDLDEDEEEGTTLTGKFYSGSSPMFPSALLAQEDNNNYYKTSECDSKRKEPSTTSAIHCDNFIDSQEHLSDSINAKFGSDWQQNSALIQNLSSFCAIQILNIDYLLGKTNRPFLETVQAPKARTASLTSNSHPQLNNDIDKCLTSISEKAAKRERILLHLHSAKMRGMSGLLCSEKLNTSAIQLQLTAQSQTEVTSHRKITDESPLGSSRSKRQRRDT